MASDESVSELIRNRAPAPWIVCENLISIKPFEIAFARVVPVIDQQWWWAGLYVFLSLNSSLLLQLQTI